MPGTAESRGVSVVIPAHNYARYLPEAVASVLAQTWDPLEIIVVDDGSIDDTREVVSCITDPRVRYVWQENAGLSSTRNAGIREARFPFVAFLDADDVWQPGLLSAVMQQFSRRGESFAMVAANTARIDAEGHEIQSRQSEGEPDREYTARDFILRNRPLASSAVVRRSVFDECGLFDPALRSSEDRDLWIRIAGRHRVWFIGEPLGFIRRHPRNMSRNAARMKENSGTVLRNAWRSGAVPRRELAFWLRAFSVHYFQVAWTHFSEGLRWRALAYLGTSIALWPCFLRPARIYERPLFRCRAFAHFLLRSAQ